MGIGHKMTSFLQEYDFSSVTVPTVPGVQLPGQQMYGLIPSMTPTKGEELFFEEQLMISTTESILNHRE